MTYGGYEKALKILKISFESTNGSEIGYSIDVGLEYTEIFKKLISIMPSFSKFDEEFLTDFLKKTMPH